MTAKTSNPSKRPYTFRTRKKPLIETSWTIATAKTTCMRCGGATTVDVRHEVTVTRVSPYRETLHPPGRLPRKLCASCLRLADHSAPPQFTGRTGPSYKTPVSMMEPEVDPQT